MTDKFLTDRYKNLDMILDGNGDYIPEDLEFNNAKLAAKLLDKHLYSDDKVIVHADVDFDGLGCAYEISTYFKIRNSNKKIRQAINAKKEHGINEKAIEYFNNKFPNKNDLVIIVDSSSNLIEYIKKINHDVLVIDHHIITSDESLYGETAGGQYVIVNCTVDGDNYTATSDMSCGMVIYEFLKYYQSTRALDDELERYKLYHWAVATLFTDVINTDTKHNLYYINKAFSDTDIEPTLDRLLTEAMGQYKRFDKSAISFKLAGYFNRAIRAGDGIQALKVIARDGSSSLHSLDKYKDIQDKMLDGIETQAVEHTSYTEVNLTETNIPESYAGLIATKLLDTFKKTSIAYKLLDNGIAKGSFRGLCDGKLLDYRQLIENMGYYAEGHETAFGFEIPINELYNVLAKVTHYEKDVKAPEYLMSPLASGNCLYRISDMHKFQSDGNLYKIGLINSRICSNNEINIICSLKEVSLVEDCGKYFKYKCCGLMCRSFEPIKSPNVTLYIEFGDTLNFYLRNKWDNIV